MSNRIEVKETHHFGDVWRSQATIFCPKLPKKNIYKSFDVGILAFKKYLITVATNLAIFLQKLATFSLKHLVTPQL